MYHSLNLPSGTDHPVRIQDPLNILFPVLCHFIKIKMIKAGPENLPLLYHHIPVQTALHHFHHQKLKLFLIIVKRNAPLFIVVSDHFIIAHTPGTSVHSVSLLYRSTTTVSMTRSSSPVLRILCSDPFLLIWQVPAVSFSSFPSHTAFPFPKMI